MMKTFALLIVGFTASVAAYAQVGLGSISGTVLDPSGAAVPHARVVVVQTETQSKTEVETNGYGIYQAVQLRPGTYTVDVEAAGFTRSEHSQIHLQVDDKLTIDFSLAVGAQTQTVNVTTETPLLRTEDVQQGEVIDNNDIMNLPQLGRNPLSLVTLAGDVQGSGGTLRINGSRTSGIEYYEDGMPLSSGRGHSVTSLTPTMEDVQEFKVVTNGISAEYGRISGGYVDIVTKGGTNQYHGQAYEYMYNDMFNANSWAQNTLGGVKPHFRQNNFGFQLGGPVWIPKIYNGRNKTFFSFDYDIYHNHQSGALATSTVPSAAERAGDVSAAYITTTNGILRPFMYDPNGTCVPQVDAKGNPTGVYNRVTPLGGDGQHVPTSLISPVSAAILKMLPLANRPAQPGSSDINDYQAPQDSFSDSYRTGIRIDEQITTNHRIFGRLQLLDGSSGSSRWQGPLFTSSANNNQGGRLATLNYQWIKSPTMVIDLRAGVNHNPGTSGSLLPPGFNASSVGIPPAFQAILGSNNLPHVQEDFLANGYYTGTNTGSINAFTTYNFGAAVTKLKGRNSIKFGGEHRRYYDNFTSFGGTNTLTFDGNPVNPVSGDSGFGSLISNVNSMGAYLLGINDWNVQSGPQTRAMGMTYYAAFVQDDFKVSKKLTVNAGLRWDVETGATERHDKIYFWDPAAPSPYTINPGWTWAGSLATANLPVDTPAPAWVTNGLPKGAVRIAGTPEFKSRSPQTVNPHQFAPRLGVAYQINNKTVIRSSAGLTYLSTTGDSGGYARSNSSLTTSNSANPGWHDSTDNGLHYISTWANPFPMAGDITTYTRNNFKANQQSAADPGVTVFARDSHMPREYVWNFSVQRELPFHFVIDASYNGNRGLGLLAPNAISQFPKALLTPSNQSVMTTQIASPNAGQTLSNGITGPTQKVGILEYPYPYFGFVNILGSNLGASTFNALNIRLNRRFSDGIAFLLNYTLSKNYDNVGGPEADSGGGVNALGTGGKTVQSVDSFQTSWGVSGIDQTHRIVAAYSVELPVGRGKRFIGAPRGPLAKIADGALGGWEIAGITQYHSGNPIIFGASNSNVNNSVKDETTFGSYTSSDHNLNNSAYTGDHQVLLSNNDPRISGLVRRFDPAKLSTAQSFTYGTLPVVYPDLRQPGNGQTDLSLMKRFSLFKSDGSRFLQVRAEAQNAFNIRGFGSYNTTIGSANFGLITSAGNTERHIQLSARIVF